MGVKTSTAFVPPELAAIIFKPAVSLEQLQAQLQALLAQKKQASDDGDEDKESSLLQNIKTLRSQISQKEEGQISSGDLLATAKFDVWSFGQVLFEVHRF